MSYFSEDKKGIQAQVVLDSVSSLGYRLTTFVIKFPRFINAELLRHRIFSFSSESSRARPVSKKIRDIIRDPVKPRYWGKKCSGMAAKEEMAGWRLVVTKYLWFIAMWTSISIAWLIDKLGGHKEFCNRILEPFSHIEVILSTTHIANFFKLRNNEGVQPEMRELAKSMLYALNHSSPKMLKVGEWHIPMIDGELVDKTLKELLQISAGRCARVSYLTHDGKTDSNKDIELAERLMSHDPMHASPFEHQAMALNSPKRSGNFVGFLQYRKLFSNEFVDEYKTEEINTSCLTPQLNSEKS